MLAYILFGISGVAIATLTVAKRIELRKRRTLPLLKAVSRSDEHLRSFYHSILKWYSGGKHKLIFLIKKQLPLRIKNQVNRVLCYLRDLGGKYFGNIRNSRAIRREGDISEFFKNIKEVEKGSGEIHDTLPVIEVTSSHLVMPEIIPKKKKVIKRYPRRKKLMVVEGME